MIEQYKIRIATPKWIKIFSESKKNNKPEFSILDWIFAQNNSKNESSEIKLWIKNTISNARNNIQYLIEWKDFFRDKNYSEFLRYFLKWEKIIINSAYENTEENFNILRNEIKNHLKRSLKKIWICPLIVLSDAITPTPPFTETFIAIWISYEYLKEIKKSISFLLKQKKSSSIDFIFDKNLVFVEDWIKNKKEIDGIVSYLDNLDLLENNNQFLPEYLEIAEQLLINENVINISNRYKNLIIKPIFNKFKNILKK